MGTSMENFANEEEHIFRSQYSPVPIPDNVTLPEFVLQNAELYADKVAFVDAVTGKGITYNEVVRDTKRFSKALRSLGIRKGNVVIVVLPNIPEYAIVALGIMASGGVFSGANPASHTSEIKKQAESADAKLIVTNSSSYDKVKGLEVPVVVLGDEVVEGAMNWNKLLEAADRAGDDMIREAVNQNDLCAMPFSSGTTGMSKGVMLTHRNLVANLCSTLFGVAPEMVGKVTILGLIPFFHIYGITGICCATLRNKGKVVVMGRFELKAFLNALITHEITFAPIVPPIILSLVKNPIVDEFDLSKLKLQAVMTAAAPLAPELLTNFEHKFPGVLVQEAYGLTEHSCITLTHAQKGLGSPHKNSVGFILPNLEVKFVDPETGKSLPRNTPGELCVRSQCVMQGYYKQVDETAQTIDKNGWLHTGDIGFIDDEENVFIVDRIKELIKYKGFQVAPAELEAILLSHPSIEDAAVVSLPDEEAGEIPAASVVLSLGAKESEEDIMNYVASNAASYKKVRVVHFVESIPKSPSGKIMRRLVKEKMVEKMKTNSTTKSITL
ncbi:4-coumarate--CoA ligase-like 1 [Lotus japonicus]|uniref:4-coumarate--CoA ligase-like 1 n=1 Tax=Lotus japonicus TaxID=34305 RepID=UPI0025895B8D|nr:4-coumarate--CoA ligase-like 1 [Lotus japonicus]